MLLILSLIRAAADLSEEYYIKQHGTNKYMATLDDKSTKPLLVDFELADKYKISNSQKNAHEKIIYVSKMPTLALDMTEYYMKLSYYPFHGLINQRFVIETIDLSKNTSFIKNQDLCLEYLEEKTIFERKKCDSDNKNQIFEIIPVSKISEKENSSNISNTQSNPEINSSPSKKYIEIKKLLKKFEDIVVDEAKAVNSYDVSKSKDSIKPNELEEINNQLNCMIRKINS